MNLWMNILVGCYEQNALFIRNQKVWLYLRALVSRIEKKPTHALTFCVCITFLALKRYLKACIFQYWHAFLKACKHNLLNKVHVVSP